MNCFTLSRDGQVRNYGCGEHAIGAAYLEEVRKILPNAQIRVGSDNGWSFTVLRADGSLFRIEEILAHKDQFLDLLQAVHRSLLEASNGAPEIPDKIVEAR
jgi:hypothetical protein